MSDTATPASTFRYPHPPVYNNKRDGFSIMEFLDGVELFFVGAHIPPTDQVHTCLAFAGAQVIAWWRLQAFVTPPSYAEFAIMVKKEFSPANFKEHVLNLIMLLRMEGKPDLPTVIDYINRTRTYTLLLKKYYPASAHPMLDDTVRTAFLRGLPLNLHQMVEITATTNNQNLGQIFITTETHADTLYGINKNFHKSTNSTYHGLLAATAGTPPSGGPEPMELDHLTIQFNNINKRLDQLGKSLGRSNNNDNNGNPPPMTPDVHDWCVRKGACFRCREIGHQAHNCPKYGNSNNNNNNRRNNNNNNNNNNRRGRWVYQVAVGDSPESGKASDDQA